VRDAARRAGAVSVSAEDFIAALRSEASTDDEDDTDRAAVKRGGNPRRASQDERAARRALARLRSLRAEM
jgi:hypothetical protein